VLVNAIYFNAAWATPFPKEGTATAPFHAIGGASTNVDMMTDTRAALYHETADYQLVKLDYQGDTSMIVVLPAAGKFASVEASLDGPALDAATGAAASTQLQLRLPKFSIAGESVSLKKPLETLGMVDAFEEKRADFSGISGERLWISDVVHKAFVKVAESGTEAAAATAVVIKGDFSISLPDHTFTADRPFLFYIRHNPTGSLLFAGRVTKPN
jgi:serpin B